MCAHLDCNQGPDRFAQSFGAIYISSLAEITYAHTPTSTRAHPLNTQHHLLVRCSQICWCVSTWCIKETEAERSKTSPAVLFCSAPLNSNANVCQAIRQAKAGRHACSVWVTIDPPTIHICGNLRSLLLCSICLLDPLSGSHS